MISESNLLLNTLLSYGLELPDKRVDLSDRIASAGVSRTYIIAMTGRSGSTWLASTLQQLEAFGSPEEYFSEETIQHFGNITPKESFSDYFQRTVSSFSSQGCFGFKSNAIRLFWLGEIVDLAKTFPETTCSWIDMRRWNIVKQAFSFARAKRTGLWHLNVETGELPQANSVAPLSIPDQEIWQEIALILRQEQLFDKFYSNHKLSPLRINYEEMLDSKYQLLLRVCRFIRPDLSISARIDQLVDKTSKLSGISRDTEEEAFIERNAAALERLNSGRLSGEVEEFMSLAPDIESELTYFLDRPQTADVSSPEAASIANTVRVVRKLNDIAVPKVVGPTLDLNGKSQFRYEIEGYCPICEKNASFVAERSDEIAPRWFPNWFRASLFCASCKSPPRERAIAHLLTSFRPKWRELVIHECSPGGWAFSGKLRRECRGYVPTQYDPSFAFGEWHESGRWRNENLEQQTFADESFDVVITQDVFEHLFHPGRAAREIARTLKPGGLCLMTVPVINPFGTTARRAALRDGEVKHILPEMYHGNPVGDGRSLVTVDWCYDIGAYLSSKSGLPFTVMVLDDMSMGIRDSANTLLFAQKGRLADIGE